MSAINGASRQSVEDLLSSIRTTGGDNNGIIRPATGLHVPFPRRDLVLGDDAAEFDLPAIFKPGHQSTAERQKLLGRLSEALRTNMPDIDTSRTILRFEPAPHRMMEPTPLRVVRNEAKPPVAAALAEPEPAVAVQPPVQPASDVKRVMPTFFDTRLSRMAEMTRQANTPPTPAPEPARAAAPLQPHAQQPPALPPGLPAASQGSAAGGVEDAAAQLLRPMLRQWLTENMPKIVEAALRSEMGVADSSPPAGRR